MPHQLQHVTKDELTKWLSELLQIDTTNPPGDEEEAAKYVFDILVEEGLEPELIYSESKRVNVFLRLKGKNKDPKLMLTAHLDVVPAETDTWIHPPFSGKIIDGEIWGRGAFDCKGLAIMELGAIIELVRSGTTLNNDLIYLLVADEEVGGEMGAKYLVDNHPEKTNIPYIINEGGGMVMKRKNKEFLLLNNSEKGAFWGYIIVEGRPGHASIPKAAINALEDGAKLLSLILKHNTKIQPSEDVLDQISYLGGSRIAKFLFSHQRTADLMINHPFGGMREVVPTLDAMIRPTIVPTMIEASNKVNVIPGSVRIDLDCRLLPGQDWSTVQEEIQRAVGKKVKYTLHQAKEGMGMVGSL